VMSAGNENFTTVYFSELNHYLGVLVKDFPVRDHIKLDAEVLKSVVSWLNENLLPIPAAAGEESPAEPIVTEITSP
ncbi:MAG: hypothetical protein U9R52_01330, partial [Candidatus Omnitrophota bacterium]|nr:hypothetical protein [Candidatus Omnitrophota bacterium]